MAAPWLSVIIPTFNGQRFLSAALKSLPSTTQDIPFEIIALDDGSSDSTVDILRSFASSLPLRIIDGVHRGSWISTTNIGLSEAKGKYISFLHQDDCWQPQRLQKLKDLADKFPQAVTLLHDAIFIDDQDRPMGTWRCPFGRRQMLISESEVFEKLIVQNFIAIPSPIFARDALAHTGLLDHSLWFTADWKLWLSLARLGPWGYLPEELACFRIHSGSQTITGVNNPGSYKEQYERILAEFLPYLPPRSHLKRISRFSAEVNQILASFFHRQRMAFFPTLIRGISLGPLGWYRYVRYSRILERVGARLRVRLQSPANNNFPTKDSCKEQLHKTA